MVSQAVGAVAVLAAGGDYQQPEAQHVGKAVPRSASRPPSDDSDPPPKRVMIGLPSAGDRPSRGSVASGSAGMVSGKRQRSGVAAESYGQSMRCTIPANPGEFSRLGDGLAKKHGVALRQSYARVGKHALIAHQRYAHAKQFTRATRSLRKIRTSPWPRHARYRPAPQRRRGQAGGVRATV